MGPRAIILTPLAITDLEEIEDYLTTDSKVFAQHYISRILARMRVLREFPEVGHLVPECLERGFRQIRYQNYRIIYQIKSEEKIYILRVIHSARQLDTEDENFGF
jgi:toxin ParE1/3/4